MDRLASIAAFVGVAESGGFSAAGRRLNMSTTMISNHVRALEHALGARLFNRTTRRVSLTEIGRDYYGRCSRILQELKEAEAAARVLHSNPRGKLRVHCHHGLGKFVAPLISRFLAQYSDVTVDLRAGDGMIDLVQEGIDLAITAQRQIDSNLVRRRLAQWNLILCCAPSYLEQHGTPRRPSELSQHNCLRYPYTAFGDDWSFIDKAGIGEHVHASGTLVSTSIETLRDAALAGLGVWLTSPGHIDDLLSSGRLVRLLDGYAGPAVEVIALYPHRQYMTATVSKFIDLLIDEFAASLPAARPENGIP